MKSQYILIHTITAHINLQSLIKLHDSLKQTPNQIPPLLLAVSTGAPACRCTRCLWSWHRRTELKEVLKTQESHSIAWTTSKFCTTECSGSYKTSGLNPNKCCWK